MRIIHVIDYFQPKLGYQETFLAREHARAGHDVYVVTSDRYNRIVYSGDAAAKLLGSRIQNAGFFVEEGIQVWRLKTLFELPNIIWLAGLKEKMIELEPDLVIVHGITNISAVRIAGLKNKSRKFKLVYDDHATPDNATGRMRLLYPVFRWLFSKGIRRAADALLAILPETKTFMHRKYGIPLDRISVVPLGADTELFQFDAGAREELRKKLDIKDEEVIFIYTGKVIPIRQLPVFIEAAATMMPNHQNMRILIVGGGSPEYIDQLKRLVDAAKLTDRFTWLDAVPNDELYRMYSAADTAVLPYGGSIGIREAIACGLPIIIGKDSKITELVDGKNGFLFSEGDAVDLAKQMEKLLDSRLRREMGQNSRRLAEDRFVWKNIAEQFVTAAG
jgi:glycosyltransferase involved in cell wall biosynthesis